MNLHKVSFEVTRESPGSENGASPHTTVEVRTGTLLTEAASLAGIELMQPCGGQGRCGRCVVQVLGGNVRQRSTLRLSQEDYLGAAQVFRIGHLGDFNDLMLAGTLCGVGMGLDLIGVPHDPGGVAAALDFLKGAPATAGGSHGGNGRSSPETERVAAGVAFSVPANAPTVASSCCR